MHSQGKDADALQVLDRALERDPDNPWLLSRRAVARAAVGEPDDAARRLQQAVELSRDDPEILLLASEVAFEAGDRELARSYGRRAIAGSSSSPDAYLVTARASIELGDREAALTDVRAGRAVAPGHPGLLRLHAGLLADATELDGAVELFRWLCTSDAALVEDHARKAELLGATGAVREALQVISGAERRWPDNTVLLEVHGRLLRLDGRLEESVDVLHRAVELEPAAGHTQLVLAQSLLQLDDPDSDAYQMALQALPLSAELLPDSPEPAYIQA